MDPVEESQTVTVTVTTDSFYSTVSTAKLEETKSFTLTFENPCFDTNFVQIVAAELEDYEYIVFNT